MRFGRWLGALALASAALTVLSPARADSANQACTNNDDITVVIDFQNVDGLNEGVNVRCAPQDVPTGRAALVRADIAFQDYRGFVCRISGLPKAGPCNTYPPASAYWVYWLAPRGGEWCASNLGFDARRPPAGTIEGWSFAKNTEGNAPPPRFPVPAPIPGQAPHPLNGGDCDNEYVPTPPTTSTPATTARGVDPTPSPTDPPAPGEPTATTRRGATTTSSSTSTVVTAPGDTSVTTVLSLGATTSSVPFGNVDLSINRGSKRDSGFPTGLVVGGALVVGVVGLSALTVLRRRNELG